MGAVVCAVVGAHVAAAGGSGLVDEVAGGRRRVGRRHRRSGPAAGARVLALDGGAGRARPWRPGWRRSVGELVVFLDADVREHLGVVRHRAARPAAAGRGRGPGEGVLRPAPPREPRGRGRVTELMARPLLEVLFPHLPASASPWPARRRRPAGSSRSWSSPPATGWSWACWSTWPAASARRPSPRSTSGSGSTATARSPSCRPPGGRGPRGPAPGDPGRPGPGGDPGPPGRRDRRPHAPVASPAAAWRDDLVVASNRGPALVPASTTTGGRSWPAPAGAWPAPCTRCWPAPGPPGWPRP